MTDSQLENIFTYHAPFGDQPTRYNELRNAAKNFAVVIQGFCPESREKKQAIGLIQSAVMWANASIALNEVDPVELACVDEEEEKEPDKSFTYNRDSKIFTEDNITRGEIRKTYTP